jgi:hypothetical protein
MGHLKAYNHKLTRRTQRLHTQKKHWKYYCQPYVTLVSAAVEITDNKIKKCNGPTSYFITIRNFIVLHKTYII